MDPSNNNSFGSPQAPGAIVSGEGTAVDNTGTGGVAGGFSSSNFPSGGITVGGSGDRGPRKSLIIGVIVAFVLLLGGGLVALAATNGMFGGGNNSGNSQEKSDVINAKTAFNSYVNYVANGEESAVDVNEETINSLSYPYYTELNGENLDVYLENVKKKSDTLGKALGEEYAVELHDMNMYVLWLAEAYSIDYNEARSMFVADGYEKTVESINKHFDVNVEDVVFEQYITAAKEAAILEINMIQEANSAGCYSDGKLVNGCYSMPDEKKSEYNSARARENETKGIIRENAIAAALALYDNIYNDAEINDNE